MNTWLPPVRLDLYPSESLAGFFIRLCDMNGWWSQRDLAEKLGVTGVALRYQLGDLDLLARSLGLPAGSLPLPASRHGREQSVVGGHTFSGRHFHRNRRICPHCIEETGYQRAYWELTFVTRCHLHGVALVTSCACGTPLNWTDHALASCNGCVTSDPLTQATTAVPHKRFQSWALRAIGVIDRGDDGSGIDGPVSPKRLP